MRRISPSLLLSLLLFTLAGCPSAGEPGIDAALPPGPFACGAMTCDEGQVCVERISATSGTAPVDTGSTDGGVFAECVARPPECASQGDCVMSSCSQSCADVVCRAIPGYATVMLTVSEGGRVYRCVRSADAA